MRTSSFQVTPDQPSLISAPSPLGVGTLLPHVIRDGKAKRVFDLCSASSLILLLFPLLTLIAVAMVLLQGRPIFFRHMRVGRDGKRFFCLKFRTMVVDAERALITHLASDRAAKAEWELSHKLKQDPRITPFGAILRKTSIDELPQLLNVLRGEMSLVGPRPIVETEVKYYGDVIEKYYRVRPGITGPWQAGGRSAASYEYRVHLDEMYVDQQSLLRDIVILARTLPAVLKMRGSC